MTLDVIVVRAYYGTTRGCNLAAMEEMYRAGDLSASAEDDFQLVERRDFLENILKEFSYTPHIEAYWIDSLTQKKEFFNSVEQMLRETPVVEAY